MPNENIQKVRTSIIRSQNTIPQYVLLKSPVDSLGLCNNLYSKGMYQTPVRHMAGLEIYVRLISKLLQLHLNLIRAVLFCAHWSHPILIDDQLSKAAVEAGITGQSLGLASSALVRVALSTNFDLHAFKSAHLTLVTIEGV